MFGLENNSILINLAVSLLIALVTLLYFRQQMTTIDHKVNSMFSLLTSMTHELNNLSRLNVLQNGDVEETGEVDEVDVVDGGAKSNTMLTPRQQFDSRINISDDDESGYDDESGDESGSGSDDDDESGSNSELSTTPLSELHSLNMGSELHDIKVIELGQESESEMEEITAEEITNDDSDYDSDEAEQTEFKNLVEDLIEQTIELNEIENVDNHELEAIELNMSQDMSQDMDEDMDQDMDQDIDEDMDQDMDMDVTTLESDAKSIAVNIDYSKMSVKALKDIVSSKNLASNVNKMKKQALIELLSV